MAEKLHVLAISAAILAFAPACVTKSPPSACSIEGAQYLSADADGKALCRDFQKRLAKALGAVTDGPDLRDLTIAITLRKRGAAEALVTSMRDGQKHDYPLVAIDVMDRPLAKGDVDQLADAVARMLASQKMPK